MHKYASTFISGMQNAVEDFLKKDIQNIKIEKILDGLIIYDTYATAEEIQKIRYLNNTFYVLKTLPSIKNISIHAFIKQLMMEKNISIPEVTIKGKRTFRIVTSEENNLIAIDNDSLIKSENYFSKILNLRVNRANPDLEIWIIERSEGIIFTGIRITTRENYKRVLHKGELHPQIANLMCRLADLKSTDIVADPFAGYGAIPYECANFFGVNKIFAGENDKRIFNLLKERLSKTKIIIGRWDATDLNSLTNNSINKIITDPPWGQFSEISEINNFYFRMLNEFHRLLKPNDIAVVLTSQKELFLNQLKETRNLKLIKQYNILLSGKKTGIFVIKKT